ncbi:DnaJ-domain-containing protein [Daedalea quercina L-15889]|uniref:DnaJ-domain-containing protein n=1 Tax=Daedalea quercina L-15889 TaxID=1314783 RepID=A0A165NQZ3_9APHY|nr:DnaJ-domain-containing protein [Daedalea quercina L-15889]
MTFAPNQHAISIILQHSARHSTASSSTPSRVRRGRSCLASSYDRDLLAGSSTSPWPSIRRPFGTTACRRAEAQGHYDALQVPSNASKAQIKSNYYRLSKQYHPDVNKDPGAREKFHALSEAYGVLGDDRKRRAYDRSVSQAGSGTSRMYPHGADSPYSHWSYDTRRRRGATYAWEHHHPHRPPPGPGAYTRPPPGRHYDRPQGADPFTSPHVRRATGHNRAAGAEARAEAKAREENMAHSESALWRIVQVVGIVLVVATVGGGFSAST